MIEYDAEMVWLDGELIPAREARVSARDRGSLTGLGIFETIGFWRGRAFAVTRHFARLKSAGARLEISVPDHDLLRAAMVAVTAENRLENARVRVTLTAGEEGGAARTLVTARPTQVPADTVTLVTVPWRRNEFGALSGLKTTAGCAENAVALRWARQRGGEEALFLNTGGDLCEGSVSNVFLVRGGAVITPYLGAGCLPGVTRSLVAELCQTDGIPFEERAVAPAELVGADEIFITSCMRGVQAVAAVDTRRVPAPGPLTARLRANLLRLRETDDEP